MRKENDLESWRLLFRVAEIGSVTRVADELGVEPSSVSRRLTALESALGCDLLQRSPRAISLSPAGLVAVEQLRPLLTQWDGVVTRLSQESATASGEIRVSAPIGAGQELLTPMVVRFQQEHPDIHIELQLSDRPADPARDPVDVVFRYGPIEDEALVARRMDTVDYVVCASPDYLHRHGAPRHPDELAEHTVLLYGGGRRPVTTHLHKGKASAEIVCRSPLRLNNVLAIREAAIAGGGIAADLPLHACFEALQQGLLVPALPGWALPSREAYAVRLASRHPPRRLAIFLDWVARERRRLRHARLAYLDSLSAAAPAA